MVGRKKLYESCQESGCGKEHYAKGKCRAHYNLARKKPKVQVVAEQQVDAAVVVEAQAAALEQEEAKP